MLHLSKTKIQAFGEYRIRSKITIFVQRLIYDLEKRKIIFQKK